jgi:hypothetical protein
MVHTDRLPRRRLVQFPPLYISCRSSAARRRNFAPALRIAHTPPALRRLARKLGRGGEVLLSGGAVRLRHPTPVVAARARMHRGASSLIPKRAGERVKTDRRDAASLAKLHRAGQLTAV